METVIPEHNNQTILCIEDEFFISELYDRALRQEGFQVTTALNGDDGLDLAQTKQYTAILLDLMVPGMNGMEILRTLRDPTKNPDFTSKIIITTNLEQSEEARNELEAQADGYIIKASVTPKELAEFVKQVINQ